MTVKKKYPLSELWLFAEQNEQKREKFLLVLPVEVAPLSTEVLYARYGVLHELRAKRELWPPFATTIRQLHKE